ncbi:ATP-binding cassette domain-containing protein [Saccharibacillus kuerlensis]|uniref:ABC transporter domain-containing protein n=1 Tax=Saccharibacillus kuerlensis TaxID=459527 RepID=A0ABQ2L616_9BACL|nr:ABC transporter ATP-binding protein [Saccharibacillus kuerlensis]GGO02900.1 hypothetical protein GCM10010969_26640 [Saccharibacillus kuerlensis]
MESRITEMEKQWGAEPEKHGDESHGNPQEEPGRREFEEYAAEAVGLRLKFPGVTELLFRDLSLKIGQGEKVLLLGPSGCGKSTLLQVLGGIIPRVTEVPMKAERLKVPESAGIVFQDPDTQFCMPYVDEELAFVLENLTVPREEMTGLIEAALREVGLNLPDPHVPIGSLSQGMKQRLALASVLLLQPDTLLLDEPSALLDPEGRRTIWEAVRRVSGQRTVIIVEHRIEEVIDWVDRVVLFRSDGSIMADGPARTVFGRYRAELREYGIWYPEAWDDAYGNILGRDADSSELSSGGSGDGAARPAHTSDASLAAGSASPGLGARDLVVSAPVPTPVAPASDLISSASASVAPVSAPIALDPALGDSVPSVGTESEQPLLKLENFRVLRSGRNVCAVEKAAIMPGDLIALTGPNGAGKSSLLLGLMGLLPQEGMCEYGGVRPVGRRSVRETAAKHAAFVFQNPEFQFVTNRVQDEVSFTLRSEAQAALPRKRGLFGRRMQLGPETEAELELRAGQCLDGFGLCEYADRHPYLLSLGQKRRLSVASAVVSDKPLLLLDEPTFGQDARNAFAMLDLCETLRASGRAVLMITHEPEIAERLATQIWRVEGGKLVSAEPTGRSRGESPRLAKEEQE